jgi:hypothetical protein
MAKKPYKAPDVQFINYNLSPEEKVAVKAWAFPMDVMDDLLVKLTESNFKVTISHDAYAHCYQCFLVPTPKHVDLFGYILAGRGSTPVKAFKQACWVHYKLLDENWSEYQRPGNQDIDD